METGVRMIIDMICLVLPPIVVIVCVRLVVRAAAVVEAGTPVSGCALVRMTGIVA